MLTATAMIRLALAVGVVCLTGCAAVDRYSGRAVLYNLQAEEAQNQEMLLNIVRAYLRRPMQFTTLSSITGTATASGSVGYTLPVRVPFRPTTNGASIAAFPPVPSWSFSSSMSGGPAFTVPVLDTQEFYQGILKPIPGSMYDLYIQAGYPRELLFNLFIQKIVMTRTDGECNTNKHLLRCEHTFGNSVAHDKDFDSFEALVEYLIDDLGLTTQGTEPPKVDISGPVQNINVRYIGAPDAHNAHKAQVVAPPGGAASTPGEAPGKQYGFCFAPQATRMTGCVGGEDASQICGHKSPDDDRSEDGHKPGEQPRETAKPRLNQSSLRCDGDTVNPRTAAAFSPAKSSDLHLTDTSKASAIISKKLAAKLRLFARGGCSELSLLRDDEDVLCNLADKPVTLTFYVRSTESMIYYLGEVARRQLNPEFEPPRPITVKYGPDRYDLFVLHEGLPASDDFLSVFYDGRLYSVAGTRGPERNELSSQVLSILREQIALNSSAKSLPQSNVISVVGQ
ncbi:MAG TPA: hypothetical protein VLX44_15610 [Xanthobacteraceae bacterium]|nr:hypothetical protein [Xanthobacteraceae bacterium]